jgi:hypothetical protein
VLPGAPTTTTTEVDEDVDGEPPWDVLSGVPATATTEVDEDVDGGPRWQEHWQQLMAFIKCIYLPPTYLHFIQDIEDMCLLLMSFMSFVDLSFQEHRMMEKHNMDQNPCISSLCPKYGTITENMT